MEPARCKYTANKTSTKPSSRWSQPTNRPYLRSACAQIETPLHQRRCPPLDTRPQQSSKPRQEVRRNQRQDNRRRHVKNVYISGGIWWNFICEIEFFFYFVNFKWNFDLAILKSVSIENFTLKILRRFKINTAYKCMLL